jgi:20S proteasome alpha/beta subunit
MTICVGIVCRDGVALAADTQESYGQEKSYVAKLVPVESAERSVIVAGSGLTTFIEYATQKIATTNPSGVATPEAFEARVRELMEGFYEKEFRLYPCDEDSKRMELLIGVRLGQTFPFLLHVDSTVVKRVGDARAIGAGMFTPMATDFFSMQLTVAQAVWACMYVVKEAKLRYEGIGGNTQIILLRQEGFQFERSWDIPQREQVLGRIDSLARRLLIGTIPATADGMLNASIQSAADLLRATRKDLQGFDEQFLRAVKTSERLTERSQERVSKVAWKETKKRKEP